MVDMFFLFKLLVIPLSILGGLALFFWVKEEFEFRRLRKYWEMTPENMQKRGYNKDGSKK